MALPVKALKAGQESYWLDQIARNREEYFSGCGESPGRFVGSAAQASGLETRFGARSLFDQGQLGALPSCALGCRASCRLWGQAGVGRRSCVGGRRGGHRGSGR